MDIRTPAGGSNNKFSQDTRDKLAFIQYEYISFSRIGKPNILQNCIYLKMKENNNAIAKFFLTIFNSSQFISMISKYTYFVNSALNYGQPISL